MLNKKIDVQVGSNARTFEPVPADKYTVQISDVSEVEATSMYTGELETLLNFEFTILNDNKFSYIDADKNPQEESVRGRRLWKRMRPVINDGAKGKASWYYKMLCAIEKKVATQEELQAIGINPDALIGKQVSVMVNQAPGKDGKIWNNILDFSKADKELDPFEASEQEKLSEEETDNLPF